MGWVGIVLWFLMHAGDLVSIIKQIIDLIHALPHGEQASAKAVLTSAIEEYKLTGDKSKLKETAQKLSNSVVAHASQLVTE